jgi:hypothetical protein
MAVAAVVLSIVALFVAGVSAWYTRRQAISTEGVQRTEAARRHDDLQPFSSVHTSRPATPATGTGPGQATIRGSLDLDRSGIPPRLLADRLRFWRSTASSSAGSSRTHPHGWTTA